MSYNEFLELIFTPIRYFSSWINSMATMLSHNYYFITIFGIFLFISLFWLFWNFIFDYFDSINKKYDDFNDRYENYKLFKLAQAKYLNNYRLDEFDYLYDRFILNRQVSQAIAMNHPNIVLDSKILNYKSNIEALKSVEHDLLSDDVISNNNDLKYISDGGVHSCALEALKFENQIANDTFNHRVVDYANDSLLNKYNVALSPDNLNYYDINTGEILSYEDVEKRINNNNSQIPFITYNGKTYYNDWEFIEQFNKDEWDRKSHLY